MSHTTQNTQNMNSKVTYSHIAQMSQYPTRNQAIVLDVIEGATIQEYTAAIANLIESKNIRFVSRISHSRVCMYLSSKELADRLTDNNIKVNIRGQELEIRSLISKSKRIILSNVCPVIPNHVIIDELSKMNIKPTSQISFIRAGMNDPGFAHIMSFRRQMYIEPEDVAKLPQALPINYDNVSYWIYLSSEKMACFICKEEGHTAKFCKNNETQLQNASAQLEDKEAQQKQINSHSQENAVEMEPINNTYANDEINDNVNLSPDDTVNKIRSIPDNIIPPHKAKRIRTSSSISTTNSQKLATDRKVTKKSKTDQDKKSLLEEIKYQLEPAKSVIEENLSENFPLDLNKTAEFLHETYGKQNILEISEKFSENTTALAYMLSNISVKISNQKLKNRIKRIVKRLELESDDERLSEESSSLDDHENVLIGNQTHL